MSKKGVTPSLNQPAKQSPKPVPPVTTVKKKGKK